MESQQKFSDFTCGVGLKYMALLFGLTNQFRGICILEVLNFFVMTPND